MELVYCYFSELNGIEDIGINLSSRFQFTFDKDLQLVKVKENPNYLDSFFADDNKVDVIGIVGENGSGKSSILTEIYNQDKLDTSLYIFHDKVDEKDKFKVYKGKDINFDLKKTFEEGQFEENVLNKGMPFLIGSSKLLFKEDYNGSGSGSMGVSFTENLASICSTNDINSNLNFMLKHDFEIYLKVKKIQQDGAENYINLFNKSIINAELLDNFLIANFINIQESKKDEKIDSNILIDISNKNVRISPYFDFSTHIKKRMKFAKFVNENEGNEDVLESTDFFNNTLTTINEKYKSEFVSKILINILIDLILLSKLDYDKISIDTLIGSVKMYDLFDENGLDKFLENTKKDDEKIISTSVEKIIRVIVYDLKEILDILGIKKLDETKDLTLSYKDEKLGEFVNLIKEKIYLLKYFKIENKVESIDTYNKMPFSSGELQILRLIARASFYVEQIKISDENILLLLDEPDAMLHPNWQRLFWKEFIPLINSVTDKKIKILFTTHSPIMITDIPKANLNILDQNNRELSIETFGANIYSLYKNTFFLEKPIGAFALNKIDKLYKKLLSEEPSTEDELKGFKKLINTIGEPLIKKDLQYKLNNYLNKFEYEKDAYILSELEKEKDKIESKINDIRGRDDKSKS